MSDRYRTCRCGHMEASHPDGRCVAQVPRERSRAEKQRYARTSNGFRQCDCVAFVPGRVLADDNSIDQIFRRK